MLTSLSLVFLLGLLLAAMTSKSKLPSLLGMILAGMVLGPYCLNLLSDSMLSISTDLRQLALVIILLRAGLALDINDLRQIGRPAILMCFIPACFEIVGVILIAPALLGVSILEAAIMGVVVAAVSPAIIVPRMLKLMEKGYGEKNRIPQLIMAGASLDDVFVIVLFTSFTKLASGENIAWFTLVKIPAAIVFGMIAGFCCGTCLSTIFRRIHIRDSAKVIILLSISCLLITVEQAIPQSIPFSGLIAVMATGMAILRNNRVLATRLSSKFSQLWVGAEIMLFVLVGATVDVRYALGAGAAGGLVILGSLLFRLVGVWTCLARTVLTKEEKLFCMIAYVPKATVQAAIGSIPLQMGLPCGKMVLTIAVLAILITAPLGAVGIDYSYKKLLTQSTEDSSNHCVSNR
ncbi:MAG: cation:proton antiporter [Limnochordia bacterium]|nr:cation:proton antiporter [Limnochordia bacterium]